MFSNLTNAEDEIKIETSAFTLKIKKVKITNAPNRYDFEDGSYFGYSSFCNLTQNCFTNKFIIIKVIFFKTDS